MRFPQALAIIGFSFSVAAGPAFAQDSSIFDGVALEYSPLSLTRSTPEGVQISSGAASFAAEFDFDFVTGHEVTISGGSKVIPIDPKPKTKGKSKLKKWTCGCQIVRVGKREFSATCDICNNSFRLDE